MSGYRDAKGNPLRQFAPAGTLTYAELAKIAGELANEAPGTGMPKNLSARGQWSAGYIATAEEMHLSVFTPSLKVNRPSSRAAVVQTLLDALNVPLIASRTSFKDVPASDPRAAAIATAVQLGLIHGDNDINGQPKNIVRPNAPILRAEVAKMLTLILAKRANGTLHSITSPSSPAASNVRIESMRRGGGGGGGRGGGGGSSGTDATSSSSVSANPPVVSAGNNLTTTEGAALVFTGSLIGGGTSPITYAWDFGDGTSSGSLVARHTYVDGPHVYTAQLTATDHLGVQGSASATVTVTNLAPTANAHGTYSGNSGATISFIGSATDPGTVDTASGFTFHWNFGDGHTSALSIHPALPVAHSTAIRTINEGSPLTLTGSVSGGATPLSYQWTFGDSTSSGSLTAVHTYTDGPHTYTAILTVTDALSRRSSGSTVVTVNNVAPTPTPHGTYSGTGGIALSFTGSATDPGTVDTASGFTFHWNFGDGSGSTLQNPTHVYSASGSYAVTLTATDKDGGTGTGTTTAAIAAPFSPSQISGLSLWLKADAGLFQDSAGTTPATANAAPVGKWTDQSVSGNNATQATAGNRAGLLTAWQNAKPAIRFRGTTQSLTLPADLGFGDFTIVLAVNQLSDSSGNDVILGQKSGVAFPLVFTTAGSFWYYDGVGQLTSSAGSFTRNVPVLVTLKRSGSTLTMYANGVQVGTGNVGTTALPMGQIAARAAGGLPSNIDLFEAVFYNSSLNNTDRRSVESYLTNKWGINGSASTASIGVSCLGDSLTAGFSGGITTSYPYQLVGQLPLNWVVANYGNSGDGLASMQGRLSGITHTFGTNILVLFGGVNDLLNGASGATAFSSLQSLVTAAQALGFDVRIATLPDSNHATSPAGFQTEKTVFNAAIVAGYPAAKVIRLDLNANIGANGASDNATYFNADKLHMTAAGYLEVANEVYTNVTQ